MNTIFVEQLRGKRDPSANRQAKRARYKVMNVVGYLESHLESLINYRPWRRMGRRISTGFVESSINRIVGRRMGKGPTDAWSRAGARRVLQVRVALLNEEWRELAQRQFPWIGQRCVTWPWQKASQAF